MATRKDQAPPAELVEELDTAFERGAAWIADHPQVLLLGIGAILAVAALTGGAFALQGRSARAAEAEISGVYDSYVVAMGATPGAREIPEPANAELGRRTRAEFAAKLLTAASAHDDSAAAVAGRLQAAEMLEQNGDAEGAFAARQVAAEHGPRRSGATAIALSRFAVALETKGDLQGAAEAFEKAGEIDSPGRALALADAARCFALKGDKERALALYARAEKLGVDEVPVHVRQRLIELRGASPTTAQ